jgi:hypothetical protein
MEKETPKRRNASLLAYDFFPLSAFQALFPSQSKVEKSSITACHKLPRRLFVYFSYHDKKKVGEMRKRKPKLVT